MKTVGRLPGRIGHRMIHHLVWNFMAVEIALESSKDDHGHLHAAWEDCGGIAHRNVDAKRVPWSDVKRVGQRLNEKQS